MKVFIVGGTGLLGSAAAKELVARGHEVVSLSLPPLPEGAVFPPQMKIEYGNYLELSDEDFRAYFRGCDAFVFAAGVDERVEAAPPVYELYRKYNIAPTERLLRLAKECGVKRAAICGSYFALFRRLRPEWALDRDHPYIRSRTEQEKLALSFADEKFFRRGVGAPVYFRRAAGPKTRMGLSRGNAPQNEIRHLLVPGRDGHDHRAAGGTGDCGGIGTQSPADSAIRSGITT